MNRSCQLYRKQELPNRQPQRRHSEHRNLQALQPQNNKHRNRSRQRARVDAQKDVDEQVVDESDDDDDGGEHVVIVEQVGPETRLSEVNIIPDDAMSTTSDNVAEETRFRVELDDDEIAELEREGGVLDETSGVVEGDDGETEDTEGDKIKKGTLSRFVKKSLGQIIPQTKPPLRVHSFPSPYRLGTAAFASNRKVKHSGVVWTLGGCWQ